MSNNAWLINSGCTNHMAFDDSMFQEIDRTIVSKVKIGNEQLIDVKGKGTVKIMSPKGAKLINDVLYVPEIDQNLLSVSQLLQKGYSVVFKHNKCEISDSNGAVLFSIAMKDKSFSLSWEKQSAYTCVLKKADLWHKRLGHFYKTALEYMQKEKLVLGMDYTSEESNVCEACQLGK